MYSTTETFAVWLGLYYYNAYSGGLCQPISNDKDIRPVAYFSGTFTAENRSWCATEKEAYAY